MKSHLELCNLIFQKEKVTGKVPLDKEQNRFLGTAHQQRKWDLCTVGETFIRTRTPLSQEKWQFVLARQPFPNFYSLLAARGTDTNFQRYLQLFSARNRPHPSSSPVSGGQKPQDV